jgi:ribonuclease HI
MAVRHVVIFTDGGCITQNPARPGGWAAILIAVEDRTADPLRPIADAHTGKPYVKEFSGRQLDTTSNQMEITACIEGLSRLTRTPTPVLVVVDSRYVYGTMTEGWKRRKNNELWTRLDAVAAEHDVIWQWTSAHSANDHEFSRWNNRADALVEVERLKAAAEVQRGGHSSSS